MKKLVEIIKANKPVNFGSYAAEMSFYIIWAIVPIMLIIANVIVMLPVSQEAIISAMETALPDEVETLLIPILKTYMRQTDLNAIWLGMLIALWPASNVFNTLQRVLNDIYQAQPRNGYLARGFAYLFTLATVVALSIMTFLMVLGEKMVTFINDIFHVQLVILDWIVQQSWIFAIVGLFVLLVGIYHFIPNLSWKIRDSVFGATFSTVGFAVISRLFSVYIDYAARNATSNTTIGVFISLMIWLYFNCMVIIIGAYINLIWYQYRNSGEVEKE
ncbi:YihY/virulence factor BrkB family protein [Aerococcaceae bacterium NML191292]|nr:YihY/virulence factor BrkB family protein [Aerococcaceae bacterium NML191292]MCW6663433.1 YihY/virulence factor BrkB family protein [Aerococcaceae bacterium NML190073]MCW6665238.1 YihY/virulence factor BrkB family protein [Aerococcaceae bacterium NML191219]MCW6666778.1 YihY/virulence factor BrkB family protein [Aerococcaceae bacterium NML190938]MCW6682243.1 YihY/virulence factor BrkB family protein [Aerococcaceae bacterium NML160702]